VKICPDSNLLATPWCPAPIDKQYDSLGNSSDTIPEYYCNLHNLDAAQFPVPVGWNVDNTYFEQQEEQARQAEQAELDAAAEEARKREEEAAAAAEEAKKPDKPATDDKKPTKPPKPTPPADDGQNASGDEGAEAPASTG
jgi:hypothetical protein